MIVTFWRAVLVARRFIMTEAVKPTIVFVLGPPGAGKGTQSLNIVKEFGYVHLSAGDLLRAERNSPGSEYGELIETHIKNGSIVPVAITISLIERAMKESASTKFLIDGFPRNEDNLQGWNDRMDDKTNLKFVLFFDCSEDVCVQRCLYRGEQQAKAGAKRSDDNLDSLRKRINTYTNSTRPIIDHYQKLNLVRTVNAAGTEDEIFGEVKKLFSG
ncbi:CMPK1 [Branchiostoma lanceolatum]|uniref:UMP-CMP kinase n=1 Tax=Branchiostoma lanceolatum TaxID=7740 RepID=A0A8J9YYG9_BRALA|nr:CMPK1 [Branchiostoma lanceolatum]